jgi:hypothetical protein
MSELTSATTTKGRKDNTVFGKGFDINRGRITMMSKIIRGYKESGRTRVPPPMPPGKIGKLLIGSVIKKRIQHIFEIELIIFFPSADHQPAIIDTLCG